MSLKVLYITNIPSPYRVDFFNELGKSCELTVLYEMKVALDRDERWKSEQAQYFKEICLNATHISADTSCSFRIIQYMQDSYDIIVITVFGSLTQMIAIKYLNARNIPFFINIDGGFIPEKESWLKYALKKHFITAASRYLSSADMTTQYLMHYGVIPKNIFKFPFTSVLNSEIDEFESVTEAMKEQNKKILGIKEKQMILSVGQVIHRKGYDILIEAVRHLKNRCDIYIVGGQIRKEYIELVKKYSLKNVFFVDFMKKEDLKKYYLAADCFVLPTREDTWGLVINEAMAHGLPVITTNKCIAGCEMIENDKNGYIIPIEQPLKLSSAIDKVLSDNNLRMKMSNNNLKKARLYTIETMAKRHLDIFAEYCDSKGGRE